MGRDLYIGLMSGTSLDGVDAVLVHLGPDSASGSDRKPKVLGFAHLPFASALRAELLSLNTAGQQDLHRAALAANAVAQTYAQVVEQVLADSGQSAADITALGAHGQTVRHRPGEFDGWGYTIQLLNGALLAELSGVAVVCDFRSRDVAAGGQGAPLVPAFHARVFGRPGEDVAVLNLGGMANLTLLPGDPSQPVLGFDCGPGNVLLDLWCQQHLGRAYDADGAWGAGGQVIAGLLATALNEPYFAAPPPKSTGRDLFHADWMSSCLARCAVPTPAAQDVQATWAELTARTAISALAAHLPHAKRLVVCGGGAKNKHLMQRLLQLCQADLAGLQVQTSDADGVPADQVEALAFAWLARAAIERHPGNLASVTGAKGPRILGALYPA
jgi:anhydro-N-acetylmuramic acid kinase